MATRSPNRVPGRVSVVAALAVVLGVLAAPSHGASGEAAPISFEQLVTDIQRMLTELGYRPGPVDGAMGERTRQAIRRYQSNTGLAVDGHPSEGLRRHLLVTTGRGGGGASAAPASAPAAPPRAAAWRGRTVTEAQLRIAPSGAAASRARLAEGTELDVIRRQGAWLEVRVPSGAAEGWVEQSSVRADTPAAAAPVGKKKSGGFFANLSRGIARLLGGSRDVPEDQGNVTVGIRGLAPEDLAATIPDPAELEEMEGFRSDRDGAYRFAGEAHLTVQSIEYFEPAGAPASGPAATGGRED